MERKKTSNFFIAAAAATVAGVIAIGQGEHDAYHDKDTLFSDLYQGVVNTVEPLARKAEQVDFNSLHTFEQVRP